MSSVSDVVTLLQQTNGPGNRRWQAFAEYLSLQADNKCFVVVQPSDEHLPCGVPDRPIYVQFGSLVIDKYLPGRCTACRTKGQGSIPLCAQKARLFDALTTTSNIMQVARNVDSSGENADGEVKFRAVVNGAADEPPPDGFLHQNRVLAVTSPLLTSIYDDPTVADTALAIFGTWPRRNDDIPFSHITRHGLDEDPDWRVSPRVAPAFAVCPPSHFTPLHIDIAAAGCDLHIHTIGRKLWIAMEFDEHHVANVFHSQQWGQARDHLLHMSCSLARRVYLIVADPGSMLVLPSNWLHAVITLGTTLAIHNSIPIEHKPSIPGEIQRTIPLMIRIIKKATGRLDDNIGSELRDVLETGRDELDPSIHTALDTSLQDALKDHEPHSPYPPVPDNDAPHPPKVQRRRRRSQPESDLEYQPESDEDY